MSPATPAPLPGRFVDSCGTAYDATLHPKTGWRIRKISSHWPAYSKPDFEAAVNAGIFVFQPETP
jgi:hypothetical protein